MLIILNGSPRTVAETATVADLDEVREPRGTAVAVNGSVVPRDQHRLVPLHDGDVVEIVTAVQGG